MLQPSSRGLRMRHRSGKVSSAALRGTNLVELRRKSFQLDLSRCADRAKPRARLLGQAN